MDEIQDIFSDSSEYGAEKFSFTEDGSYNTNRRPFAKDSMIGRISTLSELFTEWYLFDSSHEKDIAQFLTEEQLTDIFTESEFMDLMCGLAYMDEELAELVSLKLPFSIGINKLKYLNFCTSYTNPSARLIQGPEKIHDKIDTLSKLKSEAKADQKKQHDKTYRETHKETIKQKRREYYIQNREKIQETNKLWILKNHERNSAYQQQYRRDHLEEFREYHRQYRKDNATAVSERKKKCYNAKKEQYQQRNKENYEKNKEKYLAQQKLYLKAKKQRAKKALTVCAAYVLLSKLKKKHKEKYLELYSEQQDPLTQMVRGCIALQTMNLDLCPWHDENCGTSPDQCCNQMVLDLPRAKKRLPKMAQMLARKRESKQRNDIYYQQWRAAHKEEKRKYDEQYRKDNAAAVSERKKKCYNAKKEQYKQKLKENYEKNKEKYLAQQKQRYAELKRKAETAKTICAMYVFLLNLRKTNRELYSTLYTAKSNPLIGMLKTCAALQNMDINMCPLCNENCGNDLHESCNQKALAIIDSINDIKTIAQNLKQR